MSFLKKLASDAVLYGMSTIVGRLLNWLMVALYTRVFENRELLAENGLFYALVVPLNIIYTFGLETAFFRFASKKEYQQKYFNLILTFIILFGATLSGLIIFFSEEIAVALNFPDASHLVILFAVILWVDAVCAIAFVKLRANQQAKTFVAIKLSNIFLTIGATLFFIFFCQGVLSGKFLTDQAYWVRNFYSVEDGPDYIIFANYIASLLTLLLLWKQFVGFKMQWNQTELKKILDYAWPLMIMGLAGSINLVADRLLFRKFLPPGFYPQFPSVDEAFGLYANVYKLSIFMTLVVQAYRYAAEPLFFSKVGDKNSPGMIALSTKWFTIACIVIWIGVSVNLNIIALILGENYRYGLEVVPVLLLANLFIGLYGNLSIWFKLSDQTQYGSYITIGTMCVTVALNIILIPIYGFMGCAIAFAISSLIMVGSCYILGQKHYPIPYETGRVLLYLAVAAGIIVLYSFRDAKASVGNFVLQSGICLAFLAFVILMERKRVSSAQ
jgi:O-antigen/teichoic acid export membrane protein